MLKKRIITAAILGSLIVLAIFKLPNSTIAIVFAGVTLIGAWEWSALIGLKNHILETILCRSCWCFCSGHLVLYAAL